MGRGSPTTSGLSAVAAAGEAVPGRLVSTNAVERSLELAGILPEPLSSFYWECRLDSEDEQVDFLACASATQGARRGLDAWAPPESGHAYSWSPIARFLAAWRAMETSFFRQVSDVWFEFDHVEQDVAPPGPSFCFCREQDYFQRQFLPETAFPEDTRSLRDSGLEGLDILYGRSLDPALVDALVACHRTLPARGRLIHLSAMLGRETRKVKAYVTLPKDAIPGYLARIGWPGDVRELEERFSRFLDPLGSGAFLDLTVGNGVEPRLGLAFSRMQLPFLRNPGAAWDFIFESLSRDGRMASDKIGALRGWAGLWPSGSGGGARIRRWLDLKLVYRPGAPLEAKAYLGFAPAMPRLFATPL